jgi:putative flippase GtrA
MSKLKVLKKMQEKISFLIIGFVNTIFGYLVAVILLYTLKDTFETFYISIASSLISIIFSFTTYNIFHFKNKKNTLVKLVRSIFVYATMIIFNAILLSIFIDMFNLNLFFSQFMIIVLSIIFLYFAHNRYTFK